MAEIAGMARDNHRSKEGGEGGERLEVSARAEELWWSTSWLMLTMWTMTLVWKQKKNCTNLTTKKRKKKKKRKTHEQQQ